jgi:hypothetical protein
MSRFCVLAIAFLVSSAFAAPKLAERKQAYLPVTIGTKWTYKTSDGEAEEKVTAVDEKADGLHVTVEYGHTSGAARSAVIRVSDQGVFRVTEGGRTYDTHLPVLRLPVRAGDTWEYDLPGSKIKARAKVAGEEAVEVPAGKFKAVRVDITYDYQDGRELKLSRWFALGFGLVREEHGGRETRALKTFVPARDK